jgi:hypothetical protein
MRPSINHLDLSAPAANSRRPNPEPLNRATERRRALRASTSWRYCTAAAFALSVALLAAGAQAQGFLAPGDAVVTGFSGTKAADAAGPQGTDPLDAFYIDLDGSSAKVFRLGVPGAPPQGQLVAAPAPQNVLARDVGQVFPIALDDSAVPNIYLGQTSAFGIQIVGASANRLKKGQADAQFMPGQFGNGGGPGSIYKVDGRTGAVTLFATIPNSGAGIGDIAFDKTSRTFFVSDLDTGLIHRLDANGNLIDSFDHGLAGRPAAGLPAAADDGAQMNITSPDFDAEDPDTWGYTQTERQVWGMAIDRGRLFYAITDKSQVWSIGINADGSFAADARLELEVADVQDGQVISDITFDAEGRMYLAQRGEIRGSYDYAVFAEPSKSAVLRYKRDSNGMWVQVREEYAIGFPNDYRNATGGVALGYAHDETGTVRRGACNRTLWSTGDNLRNDAAHAAKLADEGPVDIHGLQGNDVTLTRPQNEPPFNSYFVDYDGQFGDAEKAGHVGDVEIWQPCEDAPGFSQLVPGYPPFGYWPPGDGGDGGWVPPDGDTPTNLKLEKKAISCWKIGGGKHRCGYRITVTNTGPGVYHDHIKVRDRIPDAPGVTAIFSSPKFDACPGGPPSYTCSSLAPVHLNPWEHVTIPVRVDVPDNLAKDLECRVRNRARILHAPSPSHQNTDPGDDDDAATAHLPAHLCKKDKTNLKITKRALSCFEIGEGKYRCGFHIRVWNTGPGTYNDKIEVTDIVPGGTTAIFSGAGWNCPGPGLGPVYKCTRDPVVLNKDESVLLVARVNVSKERAKAMGCKVPNRARIDYAPAPSDQNTNPGDDHASATADIPANVCEEQTNLALFKGGYAGSDCTPTGGDTWCRRFRIVVQNMGPDTFNGQIKIRELNPANTKLSFEPSPNWTCNVATKTCQTNGNVVMPTAGPTSILIVNARLSGDNNDARALNCRVNNWARIIDPVGAPKNTQAADDQGHFAYDLPAHLCEPPPVPVVHDPACPQGSRRIGNDCLPFVPPPPPTCGYGQSLSNGHCCPSGLAWNGKRCGRHTVDPECPRGSVGQWPNCRRDCPPGTRGQPPHCYWVDPPRHCPKGTVGHWPNCRKVVIDKCPRGTFGQWPNCKRPVADKCQRGTTGTPPNCRRIGTCPSGSVGRPPNCRTIAQIKRPQHLRAFNTSKRVPQRSPRIAR